MSRSLAARIVTTLALLALAACTSATAPTSQDCGGTVIGGSTHC